MPIKYAKDISWQAAPRCPICGVGITASGRHQPFAVDDKGDVYCRLHGETCIPGYDKALSDYDQERKARKELLDWLEEDGPADPATVDALRKELGWER